MLRRKIGALDCVVAGGSDREGGGSGPVVVLLHGFGAPGDDLVPLWRVVRAPAATRFVFPAAPTALPPAMGMGQARAWWMIDPEILEAAMTGRRDRDFANEKPEGLPAARAAVLSTLHVLEHEMAASSIVLGGFSQGAMLALDVALHSEQRLEALALMSTTFLSADEWTSRMPTRRGLRVLQSHGTHDPLLPYSAAERLRDAMTAAGLAVDFVSFRGQHEIPQVVLDRLGNLLGAAFAPETDPKT